MRLQRILSSGMTGDDVRELHNELQRLDYLIPSPERQNDLFGPATKKAVTELQREHFGPGHRARGIVDQATANMISVAAGRSIT